MVYNSFPQKSVRNTLATKSLNRLSIWPETKIISLIVNFCSYYMTKLLELVRIYCACRTFVAKWTRLPVVVRQGIVSEQAFAFKRPMMMTVTWRRRPLKQLCGFAGSAGLRQLSGRFIWITFKYDRTSLWARSVGGRGAPLKRTRPSRLATGFRIGTCIAAAPWDMYLSR